MQKYTLLLKSFTGSTASTNSESSKLEFVDDYYLYRQNNGGGVVDEFNVVTYLDDPDNSIIAKNFFSYLTGNTNTAQFKEIFYDNKKLSNIFNKYYNTSVVTNTGTSTSIINLELTGTTAVTVFNYYNNWGGSARADQHVLLSGTPMSIQGETDLIISQNKLISITTEDSYYIPININLEQDLIGQINFSQYAQDFILSGKVITQGFVDMNFKTNYNEYWNTSWKKPDRTTAGLPGLNYSKYNGQYDRVPNFSKIAPAARSITTTITTLSPLKTNYILRFMGYFYVPVNDIYTFYINSDDGTLMYLGDMLLIRNDGVHTALEKAGTLGLQVGYHKIEIQFFQKSGVDKLEFFYSNSTTLKTIVPGSKLSH